MIMLEPQVLFFTTLMLFDGFVIYYLQTTVWWYKSSVNATENKPMHTIYILMRQESSVKNENVR